MGLINALGNLGGFAGPYLVGWLTDVSGSGSAGFARLAAFLAVAAALVTVGRRPRAPEAVARPDLSRGLSGAGRGD